MGKTEIKQEWQGTPKNSPKGTNVLKDKGPKGKNVP